MDLRNEMLRLITEHIRLAQYCCEIMRTKIPDTYSLLEAYRQKVIPKSGIIENLKYYFHGAGCYFELNDGTELNIDFGPNNRCDGFDLYRLSFFLKHSLVISSFRVLKNDVVLKEQLGV